MADCIICSKSFKKKVWSQKCCCKECFNIHRKIYQEQEWYQKAVDESKKKYYLNNKDKIKLNNRDKPRLNKYKQNQNYKQTQKYKEWQKAYMKKYQQTDKYKQIHNLSFSKWIIKPEAKRIKLLCGQRRRAIKNNIIEVYTKDEWNQKLKLTNGICPCCNKLFDQGLHKLTLDHFYPISKANEDFLRTGIKRIYTIDDVGPLCLSCNCSKSNKIIEVTN